MYYDEVFKKQAVRLSYKKGNMSIARKLIFTLKIMPMDSS